MDEVDRARRGDDQALAALLGRCAAPVRAALAADLPRRHAAVLDVDDVLQQTFVDAFRDVGRFRGRDEATFRAWVQSIARRTLVDVVRHLDAERRGGGRRRLSLSPSPSRERSCLDLVERLVTRSSVSRPSIRREATAAMEEALANLPEEYRAVVEGYDLAGRPMDDVARTIGRSRGAAYMLRQRAHALLRESLGGTSGLFSVSA